MGQEELLERLARKSVQQGHQIMGIGAQFHLKNNELLQHVWHIGQAALPYLKEIV